MSGAAIDVIAHRGAVGSLRESAAGKNKKKETHGSMIE
jgi:hypothetical protein